MEDNDGRRKSWAAAVEPVGHVLEDGSQVADDDSRMADEELPATCWGHAPTDSQTCVVQSYRKMFLQKSFVTVGSFVERTTYFVISPMTCVIDYPLT